MFRARVLASSLLLSFAGVTQAVPIYLDFTGTVTQLTVPAPGSAGSGASISGSFTFETDLLTRYVFGASPTTYSFLEFQNSGAPLVSDASVTIGGEVFDPLRYTNTSYASVAYNDACSTSGCAPQWAENFFLYASSSSYPNGTTDFTGSYTSTSLSLFALGPNGGQDYFDGTSVDALSFLTLPLYSLSLSYSEDTFACVLGDCQYAGQRQYFGSVDTVSRGIRPNSVPEPAPLAMLGASIVLIWLSRRRLLDAGDRLMLRALKRD